MNDWKHLANVVEGLEQRKNKFTLQAEQLGQLRLEQVVEVVVVLRSLFHVVLRLVHGLLVL
jgi:hypothetical protein